jgi:hypothetical protein
LILFLTKDVTFNFESKSKPVPITFNDELVAQPDESEIPTRFLIDQLKTHRKIPIQKNEPTNTIKTQTNNFPESPSSGSEVSMSSASSGSGSQNSSGSDNWIYRQS